MLARHHWALDRAEDAKGARVERLFARADAPLQLDFSGDRIMVAHACNRISGAYAVRDGRLRVEQLVQTKRACADPRVGALDEAISSRLQGHPGIALRDVDGTPGLELATDAGERLVFLGRPTAEARYGSAGERVFLEVAAHAVSCNDAREHGKRCLQVRELHYDENGLAARAPGEWRVFGQDIEGYAHEDGVRNVLRLKRYAVADPPAGTPAQQYVLDMVVESEVARP
jgi:heat shock protein HslJ